LRACAAHGTRATRAGIQPARLARISSGIGCAVQRLLRRMRCRNPRRLRSRCSLLAQGTCDQFSIGKGLSFPAGSKARSLRFASYARAAHALALPSQPPRAAGCLLTRALALRR
jgi:hypothetical protein